MSGIEQIQIDYKLVDGREGRIDVPNRSRVQWDLTATARKWPKFSDAPSMWATFLCWDALVRAGIVEFKWDDFLDNQCLVADIVGDEDEDEDEVPPTEQDQPLT